MNVKVVKIQLKLVITDFEFNGQNLAVYNCDFSEMLRNYEGFIVRKLFKNIRKSNPNIDTFM
jgi:hypothetical protein